MAFDKGLDSRFTKDERTIWDKATRAIEFRRQNKDSMFKELDAFQRGDQWLTKGKMPSWIPRPSTNYIHRTMKLKTGNLIIEDYLGNLQPLVPAQEEQIYELQRFYEQLWNKLNVRYHLLSSIRSSRLFGTGIIYVGWDENYLGGTKDSLTQGEILVKPIEPSTFFVDPNAFNLEDARYCGTFIRTTTNAIKSDFSLTKEAKDRFFSMRKSDDRASTSDPEDRGEIFVNRNYTTYQDDVVDLVTYYEKIPNEAGGYTIKLTYIADGVKIKTVEEIKPRLFPFVIIRQYESRQDFWGISDCQLILPNVKMINKVQSIIGTLASLYNNPQKVVNANSGIDPRLVSKYGNAYGLVYLSKMNNLKDVLQNVEVAEIPKALLDYIQFLKDDINDLTGLTDVNTGKDVGSVQGTGGVQSLIDRSQLGDKDETLVFEQALEKLSYMIIQNAILYYTDERTIRMRSEEPNSDAEFEYLPFRAEQFADIAWDFDINIIKKLSHSEGNEKEKMRQLSEWQLQYSPSIELVTAEDMIKSFNPLNKDVMLTRIKAQREQQSIEKASEITTFVSQAFQEGFSPELVVEGVFKMINPQQASLGDVQKRQQGLPE